MTDHFAYYNENDEFAAAWLTELMSDGLIPLGLIDTRSIADVRPEDLDGFTQCHWFAGIGGWCHALRLAGWPDDKPVWTGSCPCPSFSAAGKGSGFDDPRHLWPELFRLIRECLPPVVFGEQVEAAIGHGWLDLVSADLEGEGYAVGAAVLGACSVGAPHQRKRLYFVADTEFGAAKRLRLDLGSTESGTEISAQEWEWLRVNSRDGEYIDGGLGEPNSNGSQSRGLGNPLGPQPQGRLLGRHGSGELPPRTPGLVNGFWSNAEWIWCRDGRYRPTQPGIFPLASRVPNRVGALRGAGNSIVPQVAQVFIEAYMSVRK